jgi:hypothetical protein
MSFNERMKMMMVVVNRRVQQRMTLDVCEPIKDKFPEI